MAKLKPSASASQVRSAQEAMATAWAATFGPRSTSGSSHIGNRNALLAVAASLGLIVAIYWPTLLELTAMWNIDPKCSHGPLVPLVALYLGWHTWRHARGEVVNSHAARDVRLGMIQASLGLVLHLLAEVFNSPLFDVVSLVCLLRGGVIVVAAAEWNRRLACPIWFLLFMAPIPATWHQAVAVKLQQAVTWISTQLLELSGIPAFAEGYRITLPGYVMEVGDACSGLRQLTALVAVAIAAGHLSRRGSWFTISLGILSLGIAVAANCVRVTVTGFTLAWLGRDWAEGAFHTLDGLVLMGLATALVFATAHGLGRLIDRDRLTASTDALPTEADTRQVANTFPPHSATGVKRLVPLLALLVVGLPVNLLFLHHVQAGGDVPVVPLAAPLTAVPLNLGPWQGTESPITDSRARYADEHLQRIYRHTVTGQTVTVWMAYSHNGADRGHHPEVCMAVAGQPEDPHCRQSIEAPGHDQPIQQYRFGRPGQWQWLYYWHYTLSPVTGDSRSALQTLYQAFHHRPASVTFEVFADKTSNEDAEMERQFVQLLDQALQPIVGPRAVRGSHRQPVVVVGDSPTVHRETPEMRSP